MTVAAMLLAAAVLLGGDDAVESPGRPAGADDGAARAVS